MQQHYDYEAFKRALAARIKSLRAARGWTRMQMMRDYGYYMSHWQNIESGKKLSLETMLRVANTFDITLEELLQGIKRSKGPGFGCKGFHLKEPPSKDTEN